MMLSPMMRTDVTEPSAIPSLSEMGETMPADSIGSGTCWLASRAPVTSSKWYAMPFISYAPCAIAPDGQV